MAVTLSEKVALAAVHGAPGGIFVVTVIVTTCPTSPAPGVYVNANGVISDDAGLIVPAPFSVIITPVAFPPNVLPLTVTCVRPHVEPVLLLKVTVGGFTHPHDT